MKKLQLALVALTIGGLMTVDANAAHCRKNKCTKSAKVCSRACSPEECTEERATRIETDETSQCITVKVPRHLERECCDVTRTCVKKLSHCENGGWKKKPCSVKVMCDGQELETIELEGSGY